MTFDPIIVSVPHCGTRFLKERLGIEDHVHTNESWDKIWELTEGRSLIVPLRSPSMVWRSWCRRNNPEKFPYAEFFMAWGNLHALDQMCELDVICIDNQEDTRITDWTAVGDGDGGDWKLIKTDLRPLYKMPIVVRNPMVRQMEVAA